VEGPAATTAWMEGWSMTADDAVRLALATVSGN
jgi:hypothetical protein